MSIKHQIQQGEYKKGFHFFANKESALRLCKKYNDGEFDDIKRYVVVEVEYTGLIAKGRDNTLSSRYMSCIVADKIKLLRIV